MREKRSPETEEYLELLVRYAKGGRRPKVKGLAKDLRVSPASVSEMLGKLSARGFVEYERYGEIRLTGKGEKIGQSVLRKHYLIERFLSMVGIKKAKIHGEACVLEHALSDDVEQGLMRALRALEKTGVQEKDVLRLVDLKKGESGIILVVSGGKGVCRRLTDMGLTPGTRITMERSSSAIGPVDISVRSTMLAIGRGIAEKILVKVGS